MYYYMFYFLEFVDFYGHIIIKKIVIFLFRDI